MSEPNKGRITQAPVTPPETDAESLENGRDLRDEEEEDGERAVTNAPFVNKVWRIVNDEANSKYIRWINGGKSILITDREGFGKKVIPQYFKHNRFTSFVRQLNMYGWHKVPDFSANASQSSDEHWQFTNPNFVRGRPELLSKIVRNKGQRVVGRIGGAAGSTEPVNYDDVAGSTLKTNHAPLAPSNALITTDQGVKQVLKELEQVRSRQLSITDDLGRIRKDNELLWSEYNQMRQRYDKHSQTLTKIFRFLATLYGNQKLLGLDSDTGPGTDNMYFGLPPPNSKPSAGIHELREIEELQHQIDEASHTPIGSEPKPENPLALVRSASPHKQFGFTRPRVDFQRPELHELHELPDLPTDLPTDVPGQGIREPQPIDSSYFPEFPSLPNNSRLDQVEKDIESQDAGLQMIDDWIARDIPGDLGYNVDDYLEDPEKDESARKRAKTK